EIVAALELLVESFKHPARLFTGAARTLHSDVIAALLGDDTEAAFDQRQVLSVLSEQHRRQLVVLEREYDLCGCRFIGSGRGRDYGVRRAQGCFKLLSRQRRVHDFRRSRRRKDYWFRPRSQSRA